MVKTNRPYLATDAQISYLRRLLNEAFAVGFNHGTGFDPHHLTRVRFIDASAAIDALKIGIAHMKTAQR